MNREDQVHVQPVLLVIAALFGDVQRPDLAGAGGVVDGDFLELLGCAVGRQKGRETIKRCSDIISALLN